MWLKKTFLMYINVETRFKVLFLLQEKQYYFKILSMKKLTVLALAGAALMLTACNDKKETVKDAQEVAAKTGEVYNVDLAASKVDWKAFHKGGFAPRWGTLKLKSGEITVENDAVT